MEFWQDSRKCTQVLAKRKSLGNDDSDDNSDDKDDHNDDKDEDDDNDNCDDQILTQSLKLSHPFSLVRITV
jgi:hypothetical protein